MFLSMRGLTGSPSAPATAAMPEPPPPPPSYLTLGDGDFSYSLDLCLHLAHGRTGGTVPSAAAATRVTCSGIDVAEELRAKYRDAPSILGKILALDQERAKRRERKRAARKRKREGTGAGGDGSAEEAAVTRPPPPLPRPLAIDVVHGLNAIIFPQEEGGERGAAAAASPSPPGGGSFAHDHVIFNHPHLGTESAALHGRFLCHLFRSCSDTFLSPGGVLHLTLALGQAERWACLEAAEGQGMELLHRGPFRPPPPPKPVAEAGGDGGGMRLPPRAHYQSRRHQSGRSFRGRSRGSETLTFGRAVEGGRNSARGWGGYCLPWQELPPDGGDGPPGFRCPLCPREFAEERSRNSHALTCRASGTGGDGGGGGPCSPPAFSCRLCAGRTFGTAKGLEDHLRAKHSGAHSDLKPGWARACLEAGTAGAGASDTGTDDGTDAEDAPPGRFGSCGICGLAYHTAGHRAAHRSEFVPPPFKAGAGGGGGANAEDACGRPFRCSRCPKRFRDERAVRQHENFCSGGGGAVAVTVAGPKDSPSS